MNTAYSAEKGLSGHPKPELPVRHTIGSKMNVDHREPLITKIAPHCGIRNSQSWPLLSRLIDHPTCAPGWHSCGPGAEEIG
jgi:hypothetical protein